MKQPRPGMTLLECTAALAMIAGVAAMLVPEMRAAAMARREADRHQTALAEASNLLERLMAQDAESLPAPGEHELALGDAARQALPQAQATARIAAPAAADELAMRRIAVVVSWQSDETQELRQVRLVAWRHVDARHR